jgi:hypothetical protein
VPCAHALAAARLLEVNKRVIGLVAMAQPLFARCKDAKTRWVRVRCAAPCRSELRLLALERLVAADEELQKHFGATINGLKEGVVSKVAASATGGGGVAIQTPPPSVGGWIISKEGYGSVVAEGGAASVRAAEAPNGGGVSSRWTKAAGVRRNGIITRYAGGGGRAAWRLASAWGSRNLAGT